MKRENIRMETGHLDVLNEEKKRKKKKKMEDRTRSKRGM